MNFATSKTIPADASSDVRNRVLDATRHAAHCSHEAKLLKSLASDAIKDGAYAAKRALKTVQRGVHRLDDIREEAVHQVKRQPIKAVAIAAAAGAVCGGAIVAVVGWRMRRKAIAPPQ